MLLFVITLDGSNWSSCILHTSSSFSAVHQPKSPTSELLKSSLGAPSHFSEYGWEGGWYPTTFQCVVEENIVSDIVMNFNDSALRTFNWETQNFQMYHDFLSWDQLERSLNFWPSCFPPPLLCFSGSHIENWHSILRNGLVVASNTRLQVTFLHVF